MNHRLSREEREFLNIRVVKARSTVALVCAQHPHTCMDGVAMCMHGIDTVHRMLLLQLRHVVKNSTFFFSFSFLLFENTNLSPSCFFSLFQYFRFVLFSGFYCRQRSAPLLFSHHLPFVIIKQTTKQPNCAFLKLIYYFAVEISAAAALYIAQKSSVSRLKPLKMLTCDSILHSHCISI